MRRVLRHAAVFLAGFAGGLAWSVGSRLARWLTGRLKAVPPPEATWLEHYVWPHLALGAVAGVLVWLVVVLRRPPALSRAGRHAFIWGATIAPMWGLAVFAWCSRIVRKSGYDLPTLAGMRVDGAWLVIVLALTAALGYRLGARQWARRAASPASASSPTPSTSSET